jgi:hypothetical protein
LLLPRGARISPGSPAMRGGNPAVRMHSRCTDRSAGGCADWHTLVTTRARAFRGPDAAEASPRRWASWRSRGRWWRGPAARATTRPCRLSAVETSLLTVARPDVSGKSLGREPQPPHHTSPAAGSAGEGSPAPLPGQTAAAGTPTSCAHVPGKTVRSGERMAAVRRAWVGCRLGKHREATSGARRPWRGSRRPCGSGGVVSHGGARSKRDGQSPRTVR